MADRKPLYVTRPYLPPVEELTPYLKQIWDGRILTNSGPLHQQLERELCGFLGVRQISLFNNGMTALVCALRALDLRGEIITTPFSFVATANAINWVGATPVFADIDPKTLNLDPERIESLITKHTTAILPVHCFGTPCAVERIEEIARRRGLRVVYDAAHAFGVNCHCGSVLNHGDLSVLSFHATKVFNTFEGGAIISNDEATKRRIDQLRNFGFTDETSVPVPGLNGKLNELQAAVGLAQLPHFESLLAARHEVDRFYRTALRELPGIDCLPEASSARHNYSYFPILIGPAHPLNRDEVHRKLIERGIHCRRYFYPLISSFDAFRSLPSARPENLPNASAIADRILCLPIYPELGLEAAARVAEALRT